MISLSTGKLQKMKFHFFSDPTFLIPATNEKEFEVMYNPNSLQLTFGNTYDGGKTPANGTTDHKFLNRTPRELSVELVIDGSFASPTGSSVGSLANNLTALGGLETNDVSKQIHKFLRGAFVEVGDQHRPNYVRLAWGKIIFDAVFTSATVTYKLFAPDGTPLRGSMKVSLKEQIDSKKFEREINRQSPDLTRAHVIVSGDRLDALCNKFYGDSSLYHEVARVNNLSNTRKLIPGNTLVFPPIDKRN